MYTLVEISAVHGPHPLDTGCASTPGYVSAPRWARLAKEGGQAEKNGGRMVGSNMVQLAPRRCDTNVLVLTRASAQTTEWEADAGKSRTYVLRFPTNTAWSGLQPFPRPPCLRRLPSQSTRSGHGHLSSAPFLPSSGTPVSEQGLHARRSSAQLCVRVYILLPFSNSSPRMTMNLARVLHPDSPSARMGYGSPPLSPFPKSSSASAAAPGARTQPPHAQRRGRRETHRELRVGTSALMVAMACVEGDKSAARRLRASRGYDVAHPDPQFQSTMQPSAQSSFPHPPPPPSASPPPRFPIKCPQFPTVKALHVRVHVPRSALEVRGKRGHTSRSIRAARGTGCALHDEECWGRGSRICIGGRHNAPLAEPAEVRQTALEK
ncbi:hypothetical protein C8R44DRAFT_992852 [Mycena epipterygia]|nr:hypothetical protein C8R44DRAFT_992852 [Mycena epipterygia]